MRKASREMDSAFAMEVLDKAPYITVSFTKSDGSPYGVPVALSAVTRCTPTVGPKDGSFTLQYKSAMAVGIAEVVTDKAEKIEALRIICQRFLPQHMDAFAAAIERSLERTAVVKITLTEPPTGKRKQYDKQGEEMKWQRME